MNEVYTITSVQGDEYKLQFTTERSGVMFNRYVSQHNLFDFCNHVVEVEGVSEPFFFHVLIF